MEDAESMNYDTVTPSQKKLLIELGQKISDVFNKTSIGCERILKTIV